MASYQRSIAKIVPISQLIQGEYVQKEGWDPNIIKLHNDEISRVNIIGILVELNPGETIQGVIDDGTGTMSIRSFESISQELQVGSVVLVIGKPRVYNDEKYINIEIIKPLENTKWLDYRKKTFDTQAPMPTTTESIVHKIDQLDKGEGISKEDIFSLFEDEKSAENRLNKLMLNGEIFEIRPGIYKVLK